MMTVLASILFAAGWGIVDTAFRPGLWNATASLFLLPQQGDAIVNVTWSLKYELVFYLLFATLILDRRLGMALVGTWQLAMLIVALTSHFEAFGLVGFYLRSVCLEFGVGLGCAWLVAQPRFVAVARAGPIQWGMLILGTAAFISAMALGGHTRLTDTCCAMGAGATILALVLLERADRLRVPETMVMLGGASYSIYLVHYSAISLVAHAFRHIMTGPVSAVFFLPAFGFGAVTGIAFDRTLDRQTQRILRGRLKPSLLGVNARPPVMRPDPVFRDV
jgi:peptidoglycan/LPS O-acetylase OafA/YrhL